MVMEVNLHAVSLWDAIEDEHATCMEDKQALAVLLSSRLLLGRVLINHNPYPNLPIPIRF
jgi:hypothetical protein